ncbi:hypothetical protein [Ehrlichia canis]|uniref:hypothetical protein n=1 Tax=Ehrlichia canis TaxID=944 RepID=UPI00003A8421|nr:hypothetical protein [Ehrlichia canis]AUO54478.1 hypothetical protein C1I72_00985 [Ehrlichia canis]UKC53867.1 hypothetical protein s20019040002_000912 [Ehrlichia canis]UKC54803.1 hypothetical protein s20026770001_000911 [Ehrlichia canis]UKC55739.1 hypothetical protein s21009500007_000911 [Ehrlichia canis]
MIEVSVLEAMSVIADVTVLAVSVIVLRVLCPVTVDAELVVLSTAVDTVELNVSVVCVGIFLPLLS